MAKLVKKGKPIIMAQILSELEMAYIKEALRETGGNKTEAAELLTTKRSTLGEKIRRMGIDLGKV